jgi:hypothetical protein
VIGSIHRPRAFLTMLFLLVFQVSMAQGPGPLPFLVHGDAGTLVPGPTPNVFYITGEGNATHLGHFSVSATQMLIPGMPPGFFGVVVFTAANGDELHATVSGIVTELEPSPGGEGAYEITGGTGRFEGAGGQGSFISHGGQTTYSGSIYLMPDN